MQSKVTHKDGAIKYDLGKPELSLIPYAAQVAMLKRLKKPEYLTNPQFKDFKLCYKLMAKYAIGEALQPAALLHDVLGHVAAALGSEWAFASACAKSMEFGKDKYSRGNWRMGFEDSRLLDASMRHCLRYITGEEIDADSGNRHCDHIPFGLSVICDQMDRRFHGETIGKDDINV